MCRSPAKGRASKATPTSAKQPARKPKAEPTAAPKAKSASKAAAKPRPAKRKTGASCLPHLFKAHSLAHPQQAPAGCCDRLVCHASDVAASHQPESDNPLLHIVISICCTAQTRARMSPAARTMRPLSRGNLQPNRLPRSLWQ
ncbi:Hypothetical predicted protein, partial [Olea europaea subsp. europaea]